LNAGSAPKRLLHGLYLTSGLASGWNVGMSKKPKPAPTVDEMANAVTLHAMKTCKFDYSDTKEQKIWRTVDSMTTEEIAKVIGDCRTIPEAIKKIWVHLEPFV
jgi:hypothetical protein